MIAPAIVAYGAVSALGRGVAAAPAGEVGERARSGISHDDELTRAGLGRPFAARVDVPLGVEERAVEILLGALGACAADLDTRRPGWRSRRVALVLGTSSGGMRSAERFFAALARGESPVDVESPTYFGPMARAVRRLGVTFDPAVLVLGACASAALAVGLASRWLGRGGCDLAIAGGFDEVTVFVASGFEALRATTARPPPRPFRLGRDGMVLGEGAAVVALASADRAEAAVYVTGFGSSSDGVHLTAPDREGTGLAVAASAALRQAGSPRVDLVSAHGTATPFNDAAEAKALARALEPERARGTPVHALKAQIGHTLGAAGGLELLGCVDAMVRGILPASAGAGEIDPAAFVRLLETSAAGSARNVLKLAAAFGGANAALTVGSAPVRWRQRRPAFVCEAVYVDSEPPIDVLAAQARTPVDRLARGDRLVRLALAAVARLEASTGPLAGAGLVVGTAQATTETNADFAARIRNRGAAFAEPRKFPYTSPNAVAGECSIAFGMRGPSFSVGGGLHAALEALATGALLIEGGDADRVVVVAVDEVGPAVAALTRGGLREGAVAVLLDAAPRPSARARVGEVTLRRAPRGADAVPRDAGAAGGHAVLLPLVAGAHVMELVATSPPDVFARVAFEAL
ncbi:MAG TPA: beta-ketoacyl synthase N-terminal-like domain-containing protein [Polyangiaceae bacterium]|nr:beta-ketoacyl synthase N-terminal-like domain-containing protein [Polyangiaceae bacterium]